MAPKLDIAALYRQYGDMVYGRCRMLLGNAADAQETTQEIFLKLHRKRHQFRGESSPTTYLFRVTTTTCLNQIRTRKRRREDLVEEMPPTVPHDGLLPAAELAVLLEQLLAPEDERTQACVVYHFIDGMTHAEVGAMLGISGAAVRKRIGNFRRRAIARHRAAWLNP